MKRLIFYFSLICISACQKYYVMETAQQDGALYFTSSEAVAKCRGALYVASLGVEYIGEHERRVAWDIAREDSAEYSEMAQAFHIKYGDNLPRLQVHVPPMQILPGTYKVAAEAVCRLDGDSQSMLLFGSFVISAEYQLISST